MTTAPGTTRWDTKRPFWVLVDESEVRGYSVTAVLVRPEDMAALRRRLRRHLHRGQRALHFTKERPEVRKAVFADIASMPLSVVVYRSPEPPKVARARCLRRLAMDIVSTRCQKLVLDRDDTTVRADRRVLQSVLAGSYEGMYAHQRDHEEPLLWLADAISWAWNRGGEWRVRAEELDLAVVDVPA